MMPALIGALIRFEMPGMEMGAFESVGVPGVVLAQWRDQSTEAEAGHMVGRGWTVVISMAAVEQVQVGRLKLNEVGWRSGIC